MTRDLVKEANSRIKPAMLSARHHPDLTDVKVEERTWKYGLNWTNQDGKKVYNGISFEILDTKILNTAPVFKPDTVYRAAFKNHTTKTQDYKPTLRKDVTVTDSSTWSFTEKISMTSETKVEAKFELVGSASETFSVTGSIEAGQQISHGRSQTVSEGMLVPMTVESGKSKILTIIAKKSDIDVPFEMTIQIAGNVFWWAWWNNDGGRRWAGWPAEHDWLNPFCRTVDSFFTNNDDENTGKTWKVSGMFNKVTFIDLDVDVHDGPDVPVDSNVGSLVVEIDTLATKEDLF